MQEPQGSPHQAFHKSGRKNLAGLGRVGQRRQGEARQGICWTGQGSPLLVLLELTGSRLLELLDNLPKVLQGRGQLQDIQCLELGSQLKELQGSLLEQSQGQGKLAQWQKLLGSLLEPLELGKREDSLEEQHMGSLQVLMMGSLQVLMKGSLQGLPMGSLLQEQAPQDSPVQSFPRQGRPQRFQKAG